VSVLTRDVNVSIESPSEPANAKHAIVPPLLKSKEVSLLKSLANYLLCLSNVSRGTPRRGLQSIATRLRQER